MRAHIIISFCTLIFFNSCVFSSNSQKSSDQFLTKTKSVHLPLDEKSTFEIYMYQVVGDSLLVLNQVNYSLDIYSLSKEIQTGRIKIQREGANGIERLNSFYYHNQDSIFLFPQFLLTNSLIVEINGRVIDRIKHHEFKSDVDGLINHVSTPQNPTTLFDDELHFSTYQMTSESMEDDNYFHEHSLNLITGNFATYNYLKKPKYFYNNRWVSETFSRLKTDKEEWYYSWNLSDTVYHVIGENGLLKETIPILMNGGVTTNPQPVPKETYQEKWPEMVMDSYVYGKLLLDKEKNIIHRVRYLPTKLKSFKANVSDLFLEKDFEILTYTLGGEFQGLTKFKSGSYDPRVLFLGPDGIYIPKTHPNYEGLNEDEIVYDVFSIE